MLIRQDGLKSLFHRLRLDHVSEGPIYLPENIRTKSPLAMNQN